MTEFEDLLKVYGSVMVLLQYPNHRTLDMVVEAMEQAAPAGVKVALAKWWAHLPDDWGDEEVQS